MPKRMHKYLGQIPLKINVRHATSFFAPLSRCSWDSNPSGGFPFVPTYLSLHAVTYQIQISTLNLSDEKTVENLLKMPQWTVSGLAQTPFRSLEGLYHHGAIKAQNVLS